MTTITVPKAVLEQVLTALERYDGCLTHFHERIEFGPAISALRAALAEPVQEPVQEMPSNTRYTVAVKGQALTYWDNIYDAITNAQRAVYASADTTTRAIDDLRVGRVAKWSYGFSAVHIYPPQRKPKFTTEDLQEALANVGLIDRDALEVPEEYDGGATMAKIDLLWKELNRE